MLIITMSMDEPKNAESGKKTTQTLAASGLVAGLLASSCCLVPLLLVSVGISGAWISQLAALAPYQPLFLGISVIALGLGFWRAYCRQETCAPGSLCEMPSAPRATKTILWLGVAAILAAMSVDFVAPLIV